MVTDIFYHDDDSQYERRYGQWQGLIITVRNVDKPALQLHSGAGLRMRLDLGQSPLLWARIDDCYSGVSVWRKLQRQHDLLAPISAHTLHTISGESALQSGRQWLLHFATALRDSPFTCFSNGLWSLRYPNQQAAWCPRWGERSKPESWSRAPDEKEQMLLHASQLYLDWGLHGSAQVLNLYPPQQPDAGRLKWWRKVAREGKLPPILLLQSSGLQAFVILDGHLRLQACLLERQMPQFAVLAPFAEIDGPAVDQNAELLAAQMQGISTRIAQGEAFDAQAFAKLQTTLARAFDSRPKRFFVSTAKADLDVAQWEEEVGMIERENAEVLYLRGW